MSACIVPVPLEEGRWNLVLRKKNGELEVISKARTTKAKQYKRINGAIVDAKEIGFKKVEIVFQ